ncbi:hypothetical protein [Streptomyces sp. NBC_01176]|uniref:hypothetical protein n=1 Tax=Streptomyces sp. NBC_01176 TaxID=2903760 RepID=UPI00386C1DE3|nr:hypothetical protein OG199_13080 [Streptomyces sp. NBC_01176]
MGVFARLLRRSKAAEEASTAEVPAGTRTAGADAGTDADVTTTEADVSTGADATTGAGGASEPVTEEAKRSSGSENAGESDRKAEAAVAATAAAGASTSDDVEIPQQQTAEKAADNGAGESARK